MKLYETAMTPSCKRVSLFLKEIGAEVERVELNVRSGDNLKDEFTAKSVNARCRFWSLKMVEVFVKAWQFVATLMKLRQMRNTFLGEMRLKKPKSKCGIA